MRDNSQRKLHKTLKLEKQDLRNNSCYFLLVHRDSKSSTLCQICVFLQMRVLTISYSHASLAVYFAKQDCCWKLLLTSSLVWPLCLTYCPNIKSKPQKIFYWGQEHLNNMLSFPDSSQLSTYSSCLGTVDHLHMLIFSEWHGDNTICIGIKFSIIYIRVYRFLRSISNETKDNNDFLSC